MIPSLLIAAALSVAPISVEHAVRGVDAPSRVQEQPGPTEFPAILDDDNDLDDDDLDGDILVRTRSHQVTGACEARLPAAHARQNRPGSAGPFAAILSLAHMNTAQMLRL